MYICDLDFWKEIVLEIKRGKLRIFFAFLEVINTTINLIT